MTEGGLRAALEAQRSAFARGAPGRADRMAALATLRSALRRHEDALVAAMSADFGGRSATETRMLELFPLYDQIRHARRHLRRWMRRRRVPSSWFLRPSTAFYQYQPLGVVGVIGAWNYQLLLTLGPLVDALAAGNHVIVKPSEVTPRSADVIARLIGEAFPAEYVHCVTGGPDVAAEFAALPFDHLFFTGSGRVGGLVLKAAADNLTPVTLELGGKSPAIVHESYPLRTAGQRIMTGKLFNAGQTCVAPDYVLLPAGLEAAFEAEARQAVARMYPTLAGNVDYTRIATLRHWERLQALLADAAAKGARIVPVDAQGEAGTPGDRFVPPTLVFGATADMTLMQEEIFGPILPVLPYRTLEDALAFVNARPKPLALYYFDGDRRRVDRVLAGTLSGGVTVNDCVYHLGQHNLPFGGVGASGMGHYHGFDGFQTFSKKRPVMVQPRWSPVDWFAPPFHGRHGRLLRALLKLGRRPE